MLQSLTQAKMMVSPQTDSIDCTSTEKYLPTEPSKIQERHSKRLKRCTYLNVFVLLFSVVTFYGLI